jgi:hypothetical protein
LTIPTATAGDYGPSWIITNAPSVIQAGLIDVAGVGASFNTGGGRSATLEWEAYITNTISGGPMPEWSDQGSYKVLTGTANDSLMTISVLTRTNLAAGAAVVIRSRVAAAANTPTITLTGGSNGQSSVSLPTGVDVNAVDPVARETAVAATNLVWHPTWQGTNADTTAINAGVCQYYQLAGNTSVTLRATMVAGEIINLLIVRNTAATNITATWPDANIRWTGQTNCAAGSVATNWITPGRMLTYSFACGGISGVTNGYVTSESNQ